MKKSLAPLFAVALVSGLTLGYAARAEEEAAKPEAPKAEGEQHPHGKKKGGKKPHAEHAEGHKGGKGAKKEAHKNGCSDKNGCTADHDAATAAPAAPAEAPAHE